MSRHHHAERLERLWYGRAESLPCHIGVPLVMASLCWRMGVAIRQRLARPQNMGLPTIGVSSLTVGGSGKTPLVRWLAEALLGIGYRPAIISRGYGGSLAGPLLMDIQRHTARLAGDEPVLLSSQLPSEIPVVVSKDRVAGCEFVAQNLNADVLILDDALMQFSIIRDAELLVLGASDLLGNGRCLPAGPLRRPSSALREATALLVISEGGSREGADVVLRSLDTPCFLGKTVAKRLIHPDGEFLPPTFLKGKHVLAWSGIARPWRFEELLGILGANVTEFLAFPDHHRYSGADVVALEKRRGDKQVMPITTAKDATRWPDGVSWRPYVLDIELEIDDPDSLLSLLSSKLKGVSIV